MIAVSSNRAPDIHELLGAIRILGPELHEPKQPDVVTVASRPARANSLPQGSYNIAPTPLTAGYGCRALTKIDTAGQFN